MLLLISIISYENYKLYIANACCQLEFLLNFINTRYATMIKGGFDDGGVYLK